MTVATNLFDPSLGCFIEGMRLHDLAKPFFLGRKRHAVAGFLLLQGANQPTAGLYALFHHAPPIGLEKTVRFLLDWYGLDQPSDALEVPAWIFLSPWLDQLAASTYSGVTEDPERKEIWSFQNPFSRLPRLERVRTFGKSEVDKIQQKLWKEVGLDEVLVWGDIKKLADGFESFSDHQDKLKALEENATLLKSFLENHTTLLPARLFSERTYPSANDTALLEHGQLTATLAFMVGGNIIFKENNWPRTVQLTRQDGDFYIDNKKSADFSWDDYKKIVLQHLHGRLVRIAFLGYERLFHEAIRLDDLHGIKNFLESPGKQRLRELFQNNFHTSIGGLFASEHKVAPALQPLNDFPFDLVYLLPAALGEPQIRTAVQKAYAASIATLAAELDAAYQEDFPAIPRLDAQKLKRQFSSLAPFCFCEEIHIQVDSSKTVEEQLREAKQSLATAGLEAYRRLWQAGAIKDAECQRRVQDVKDLEITESCDVCTLQPVFAEFYDLYEEYRQEGDERHKTMEKVIYSHKEQPERLCRACLARRLWSHGEVQEQWLLDLIEWDEKDGTVTLRLKQHPHLSPPPNMLPQIDLKKDQPLPEDMGAAFVRRREGRLQVYPTMAAAADGDGNLALLYLTPHWHQGIVGELSWRDAVAELQCVLPIINRWTERFSTINTSVADWRNKIASDELNQIQGAKNDLTQKLAYLLDWPNTLPWHPLSGLANLIRELKPLDPEKDIKNVKQKICQILQYWDNVLSYYGPGHDRDLYRFEQALVAYVAGLSPQDIANGFKAEAVTARPHLARVLTRIRWLQEFFHDLPKILVEDGCVRTLTLESAYPRLVVAVPAADLLRALQVLHHALAWNLFSSTLYDDDPSSPPNGQVEETTLQRREQLSLWLLSKILPTVLLGAVVVAKERQPLYHLLTTARRVINYLEQHTQPVPGIRLGLLDWRQALGAISPEQADAIPSLEFLSLYHILVNAPQIARRPLLSLAQAKTTDFGELPEVWQTLLDIKQARQGWSPRVKEVLSADDLFAALHFVKRVAKE